MFDERSWNKFLQAPYHPGSLLVPSLKAFIVQTSGQEHPHSYSTDILVIVYYIWKLVCNSGFVQWTLVEQTFGNTSPPRKLTGTNLGGVHRSNIWPGASSLTFNWFTTFELAIVYLRSKLLRSSGCVQWKLLEQIFASSPHPGSSLLPSLEVFIVRTSDQEHPHWYSIDLPLLS